MGGGLGDWVWRKGGRGKHLQLAYLSPGVNGPWVPRECLLELEAWIKQWVGGGNFGGESCGHWKWGTVGGQQMSAAQLGRLHYDYEESDKIILYCIRGARIPTLISQLYKGSVSNTSSKSWLSWSKLPYLSPPCSENVAQRVPCMYEALSSILSINMVEGGKERIIQF